MPKIVQVTSGMDSKDNDIQTEANQRDLVSWVLLSRISY
jgi:hypothetical protein